MKRSSEGIIMTKWQEDDRSMGHVYPQERESKRDGEESGGREATALWRVTLFTGRRRDWGILMWGGRRKMKGDSLGWRQPLWLWKEEGVMKQRNEEKGEGVTDRRDTWRKNLIVRGKRERAWEKLKSNENMKSTAQGAVIWCFREMQGTPGLQSAASIVGFFFLSRWGSLQGMK